MFRGFSRSIELVKTSFGILRQDKEMLLFPIMSMIGLAMVTIVFFVPTYAAGLFDGAGGGQESTNPLLFIITFIYYVVAYYIMIFANAAVVGAAMMRLRGEDPTFSDAFNIAMSRAGKIFGWAVISATVGMILQAMRDNSNGLSRFVVSIIGAGWNIATFLVVPVLVVENLSPIDAIKRSGSLLKQTWGQQIVGNFGISLVMFLIALIGGVPLFLLTTAAFAVAPVLGILVGIVFALYIFAVMAISSAISGIFTAAVYAYATQTPVESPIFDPALVQGAFRAK
jgi:hypothetical protein